MVKLNGWTKVRSGLYEKYINGRLYVIEHVSTNDGFSCNEWHAGSENDPHADQFQTLREALSSYEAQS